MKEARAKAGDAEKAWTPSAAAMTLAYIAEFEESHRKVTQGDNVMIAIQRRRPCGTYEIGFMQEKNAASVYLSCKAPDFQGKRANLFTLWQNNQLVPPLKLVFKPSGDVAPDEFNTFRGLDIKPAQGGGYALFREHVDAVMALNGDTDGYLWKLIAYRLQNLGAFVPALLVLIGREGGGKSTVTSVIARLLAPYSIAFSDPEKFVGRNNADLEGKLFVQLEEMILGPNENYDSRLKHYVTSPKLDVEQKFKAQWQIDNLMFVAITANKTSAVRVTEHSRRFAVYEVEDRFAGDQEQREQFFGRMMAELEAGGYEALAYDLLNIDLDGFSPAAVPKTKLFLEMAGVDADRDPIRAWWRETLERGVLCEAEGSALDWTAPVAKDSLYARYRGWCENDGPRSRAAVLSKAEWAKSLGKMLPNGLPSKRIMVGGVRGHYIVVPEYEGCCAPFERLFSITIDRAGQPGQLKAVM
jgi:energy-coupling factor transporter ATP-binding protein EcfA2